MPGANYCATFLTPGLLQRGCNTLQRKPHMHHAGQGTGNTCGLSEVLRTVYAHCLVLIHKYSSYLAVTWTRKSRNKIILEQIKLRIHRHLRAVQLFTYILTRVRCCRNFFNPTYTKRKYRKGNCDKSEDTRYRFIFISKCQAS